MLFVSDECPTLQSITNVNTLSLIRVRNVLTALDFITSKTPRSATVRLPVVPVVRGAWWKADGTSAGRRVVARRRRRPSGADVSDAVSAPRRRRR